MDRVAVYSDLYLSPFLKCLLFKIGIVFYFGATVSSGPGPPHSQGFYITHDTPQSVGLIWTSDQLVAETSA